MSETITSKSPTHSIFSSSGTFVIISRMSVKSNDLFTPSELVTDVHEQVDIILCTTKVVVSLVQGVTLSSKTWIKVQHLSGSIIIEVRYRLKISQKLNIISIVINPNHCMECHFIVLPIKLKIVQYHQVLWNP